MRKYIIILIICLLSFGFSRAQFFQGTFKKSGNSIVLKMRPSAEITTSISYLEFSFRYITSSIPPYIISSLSYNALLPGLNLHRESDFVSSDYTYLRFVHNTSTIPNFAYQTGIEYEICRFDFGGSLPNYFEMTSDLVDTNNVIVFGVADGSGNFISPGLNNQLFGPGFYHSGDMQILPISRFTVPLQIIDFSVVDNLNNANLKWTVQNENSTTKHYEVERSLNGRDFSFVSNITANPTTGNINYIYTDIDLTAYKTEEIFYRIKQVDVNGMFIYSEIKSLKIRNPLFNVSILPNPIHNIGIVNITLSYNSNILITLSDVSGKIIMNKTIAGTAGLNSMPLDMTLLASGNYFLSVKVKNKTAVISVMKGN